MPPASSGASTSKGPTRVPRGSTGWDDGSSSPSEPPVPVGLDQPAFAPLEFGYYSTRLEAYSHGSRVGTYVSDEYQPYEVKRASFTNVGGYTNVFWEESFSIDIETR